MYLFRFSSYLFFFVAPMNIIKEGQLKKKKKKGGKLTKKWTTKYFILKQNNQMDSYSFTYYKNKKELKTPSGIFEFTVDTVISAFNLSGNKKFCFIIQSTNNSDEDKALILQAKSKEEYEEWMIKITNCIELITINSVKRNDLVEKDGKRFFFGKIGFN